MRKTENKELIEKYDELQMKGLTKSETFKRLAEDGYSVGDIAWNTKNHYSFVYGVVDSKVGITRQAEESKSDTIRKMVDEGKTPGQIAKELNSNYSWIHSVVKKYKLAK